MNKEWQQRCEAFLQWYIRIGGDIGNQKAMNEAFLRLI